MSVINVFNFGLTFMDDVRKGSEFILFHVTNPVYPTSFVKDTFLDNFVPFDPLSKINFI